MPALVWSWVWLVAQRVIGDQRWRVRSIAIFLTDFLGNAVEREENGERCR